jgi:hypothetical protein
VGDRVRDLARNLHSIALGVRPSDMIAATMPGHARRLGSCRAAQPPAVSRHIWDSIGAAFDDLDFVDDVFVVAIGGRFVDRVPS